MNSKAEQKFRAYLKQRYPDAFIWKVADFKQTGSGANKGVPDYLVINYGRHIWFEVKHVKSLKTFNFNEINENQWVTFSHMYKAKADINIAIYNGDYELFLKDFYFDIAIYKETGKTSISLIKPIYSII